MVAVAQATTYNAATDWASTYASTSAVTASNHASWGSGNAWSAGDMSWNWTNQLAVVGGSSAQQLTTYYNANTTGNETSGATIKATFTYTVPFQAYQFNPGVSFQQQVGMTFTEQIASGFRPEKNGGSDSTAITLPTGITSGGAASGFLNEVGTAKTDTGQANVAGFTITGNVSSNKFNDGDGSVQASATAVWYNYGSNVTSSSLGNFNIPSSSSSNTLSLDNLFGPTYVAWTAPGNGTITVVSNVWDVNSAADDGDPSFFVINSIAGPTAPVVSASFLVATGGTGAQYTLGNMQSQASTTSGSVSNLGALSGYASSFGLNWTSGTMAVTAGEVFYFVNDAGHDQVQSHGNHSTGTATNPEALQATVNFVAPEPSSVMLFGMAGVGLAIAAWNRRRKVA